MKGEKGRKIVDGSKKKPTKQKQKTNKKQSSGNNLRRNVNLLNMISECKIIQYNTVQLELRPINQTK